MQSFCLREFVESIIRKHSHSKGTQAASHPALNRIENRTIYGQKEKQKLNMKKKKSRHWHLFNTIKKLSGLLRCLSGKDSTRQCSRHEMQVPFLGWEDPLEKGMATHSNILSLENPIDRGAWQAMIHGVTKSWTQLSMHTHTHIHNQEALYIKILPWANLRPPHSTHSL